MSNYSIGFKAGRHLIIVTADTPQSLDQVIEAAMTRGWEPFFSVLGNATVTPQKSLAQERPSCACPLHHNTDIRKDKEKGYYCGVKMDGKWCGCHFDLTGKVDRLPNSMRDGGPKKFDPDDQLGFMNDLD